jgi:cysteine synthase
MTIGATSSGIGLVGNTPLVRLALPSALTGANILAKAEFMNPGQSIKDRAALAILQDIRARGLIKEGGTIVEGTAGNTGIGLALLAGCFSYKVIIVIPDTQTQEKKDTLKMLGAELIEVPAVPYANPNNYIKLAGRLAEDIARRDPKGAVWANQFDNTVNREVHVTTTAPEILRDTNGRIDGFICAVGTGGTLAGVAKGLRAANPDIRIGLADPHGAALHSYYTTGKLAFEGSSVTEGIGQGRITANLEGFRPDLSFRISDDAALDMMFELLRTEGLLLGGSSGINVVGAMEMARKLGPGSTVATILCDSGARYMSKLYNPTFLRSKGFAVPEWLENRPARDVPFV